MEHYPFATGDLLCRPHARLAQSEPKVKGKMNGKPPLTFSSAGAILQIWQQRNAPLPSSHILFCFTSCFGVYTKLGTHPVIHSFHSLYTAHFQSIQVCLPPARNLLIHILFQAALGSLNQHRHHDHQIRLSVMRNS